MTSIYQWDVIAANNANADSSIDWAEGMSPANVNDSARVMMGRVKELLTDLGGSIVATGTANVIAASAQSAFTTLANGRMVSFRAIATNTQATTLNVNSIGAKPVLKATGSGIVALTGREIQSGGMYTVQYSTDLNSGNGAWLLLNASATGTAAGTVTNFAGSTAPEGWLLCYGQAVSRTTYADLLAVIGTTYGAGDGTTTFNLPDLRGRIIAGLDLMGGVAAARLNTTTMTSNGIGGTGGAQTHTLTSAQMPAHTHSGGTDGAGSHSHSGTILGSNSATSGGAPVLGPAVTSFAFVTDTAPNHSHTFTTNSAGLGQAHLNVQPTMMLNTIIKF